MTTGIDTSLHALAARQIDWLGARQAVVAQNIAQASTPGYKAKDIAPFEQVLQRAPSALAATHVLHFAEAATGAGAMNARPIQTWETSHSGNTVSLDEEIMRAGEINRGFALNAAVLKSFQKLWLAGAK